MTTWKDGGMYGQVRREIVSEDGGHPIAIVRVRQYLLTHNDTEPWPQGQANFALILQAPQMLEALEIIQKMATRLANVTYHVSYADWAVVRNCASAAIAAVREGNDDDIS